MVKMGDPTTAETFALGADGVYRSASSGQNGQAPDDETQVHAVAGLFPPMSEGEYRALVEDIRLNDLREPIWRLRDGRTIDGRHRANACATLGIVPDVRIFEDDCGRAAVSEGA